MDALLHGRYFEEGALLRLRLELTDLRTGNLIGAGDYRLARSAVPASAPVKAEPAAQERAKALASLGSPAGTGAPVLTLSTDRGTGAVYKDGEKLRVMAGGTAS